MAGDMIEYAAEIINGSKDKRGCLEQSRGAYLEETIICTLLKDKSPEQISKLVAGMADSIIARAKAQRLDLRAYDELHRCMKKDLSAGGYISALEDIAIMAQIRYDSLEYRLFRERAEKAKI